MLKFFKEQQKHSFSQYLFLSFLCAKGCCKQRQPPAAPGPGFPPAKKPRVSAQARGHSCRFPVCRFNRSKVEHVSQRHRHRHAHAREHTHPITHTATEKVLPSAAPRCSAHTNTVSGNCQLSVGWSGSKVTSANAHTHTHSSQPPPPPLSRVTSTCTLTDPLSTGTAPLSDWYPCPDPGTSYLPHRSLTPIQVPLGAHQQTCWSHSHPKLTGPPKYWHSHTNCLVPLPSTRFRGNTDTCPPSQPPAPGTWRSAPLLAPLTWSPHAAEAKSPTCSGWCP